MKTQSIMIVENNTDLRNTLRHAFEDRGYMTWTCPAPEIAVCIFAAVRPNVVLLDLDFAGSSPMDLLDAWKKLSPHTKVFVESAISDERLMQEAVDHGAQAFLIKPYTLEPLFDMLEEDLPPSAPMAAMVRQAAA